MTAASGGCKVGGMETTRQTALKLRLKGQSYAQIGAAVGLSRQRVQQLLSPPSAIRKLVVAKYGSSCARCGLVGRSHHVHHKGSNNGDTWNDVQNLVLLCIACHGRAHARKVARERRKSAKVWRCQCHRCQTARTEREALEAGALPR